jgi:hypothetical protein
LKFSDERLPEFLPRADTIWGKIIQPCPCIVLQVQQQQLEGVIPGSAADFDGGYEVVEPNSGVLLPVELDYTVAELDAPWQWCGSD